MIARITGGRRLTGTDYDLFHLVDTADPATLPPLFLSCGQDDPLVGANRRFVQACGNRGIDLLSSFAPGTHEWGYWDAHVQQMLAWMWELRAGS